jgi:IS30 family transposase
MYNKGTSISDIARELGRNKGTISREIDRNSSLEYDCYLGNRAQQRAGLRAKNSHHHHRLRNEDVRACVLSPLEIGWSPEQISGRIGIDHPGWSISHESIYQYIYDSKTPDRKHLIECLRHSHRIRKPKIIGRRHHPTKIPNRIPIDQRPEIVTTREEFGHWETDRLISRKSSAALNSTCERKTKLLFLTKMPKKTAEETSAAIINRLQSLPFYARQTLTMDNGTENAKHEATSKSLGIKCSSHIHTIHGNAVPMKTLTV